jgi:hypothetical protein
MTHQVTSWPATMLVRPGLRPFSIAGYLAAISVAHQTAAIPDTQASPISLATPVAGGVVNPAQHDAVSGVLVGIRRLPR